MGLPTHVLWQMLERLLNKIIYTYSRCLLNQLILNSHERKDVICFILPIVIQAQSVKNGVKARALIEKAYAANAANSYQEALTYFIQADSLSSAVFTSDDYNMGGSYFKLESMAGYAMSKGHFY